MFNSATLAVVKSVTFAFAFNNGFTFANTLAFVKYKLPLVSITLAVYKFCQIVAEILLTLILPAVTTEFEFKLILLDVILTLLAALILKSVVDVNDPAPVAVDINVLAKTFPVKRILPPETILKSPVAVNVPVPGAVDIKLLAITLPALILPV